MASSSDTQPPHDSKYDPGHAPHESPEMWGWHAETGKWARISGFVVIAALLLMLTTTAYNHAGNFALISFAIALFIVLVWDHRRRKNSWRRR